MLVEIWTIDSDSESFLVIVKVINTDNNNDNCVLVPIANFVHDIAESSLLFLEDLHHVEKVKQLVDCNQVRVLTKLVVSKLLIIV
jgi:hypothetical protein